MFPLPYVLYKYTPLSNLTSASQYAANLEVLAFPDTSLIVKVAKRALYRTN